METLKDYLDYLLSNGYEINEGDIPYEFLDGELRSVMFRHKKTGKTVVLSCYYTDELVDYLKENYSEPGSEYCFMDDAITTKITVTGALIESNIINNPNFFDGEKNGITLQKKGDGSMFDFSHYYTDRLDLFEKCIWIQNHETEHARSIMESHFKNVDFFNENIKPIIEPYYYEKYDSILDVVEKESSSPFFIWTLDVKYGTFDITVETNCITGKMTIEVESGTYERGFVTFRDVTNGFNKDEFIEAVNLARTHGKEEESLFDDNPKHIIHFD